MASSAKRSKKLRILLIPFFATSHIRPFTDFAFHLAAARPGDVEATVAVTLANAPVVQAALSSREPCGGHGGDARVEVATYAFPDVDGLPPGVENMSTVNAEDAWRIAAAAFNEAVMRPAQESLIKASSPDAIVTDLHFIWNAGIAAELGVPCVAFNVGGMFPTLALWRLPAVDIKDAAGGSVTVPQFPGPDISLPVTELPEFLRNQGLVFEFDRGTENRFMVELKRCLGFAANTFIDLEREYCENYIDSGFVRRAYFVGPLSLPPAAAATAAVTGVEKSSSACLDWLGTMPAHSVVYLCFGSLTNMSEAQLDELAVGLESSGVPFLWVVRVPTWEPPAGWKERVGSRGILVTGWAPQTDILQHPAVGAFVTHCGWNSVLETVAAGVPVLTWPMVFEQFIIERFVTQVASIGERLWPEGAGRRSTRHEEHDLIPAAAIARAVAKFMERGGAADAARRRVAELSAKARAAMAEGGTSHRDLHQLIDDIVEARASGGETTAP
ncbi:UDP-glycosyltransferase 73E1-like [Panicum miliaceum]|uniref:Glycosyltransferase n=1 Tax=Panicum miliaceum TaxID=4540 RepID=A0A3L6SFF2_PANMI|nr:UDP-glycosyltransferase 73E1-like [Panicum miliaceum]